MLLFNSLGRKKEKFISLQKNKLTIYICGITPYDTTHLGHAFLYVFFDVVVRYFIFKGYRVNYVQNVTDIDDDILKKAQEEKKDWRELGDFWTRKFLRDMESLNVMMPSHYVKATDSIKTIIKINQKLLRKSYAYHKDGNVYFEIKKFKAYGKLSQLNSNQMLLISKERGNNPDDPLKKDPLDFVLWQSSKEDEPGWKSPWGKGRPGWHIECSAMNLQYLGEKIDIHGGGRDLIYPHHESEIAQSESFTGKRPFVRFWMHAAMVMYEGEKMSKSLGNLIMVDDLLKKYSSNAIRWVLVSHYYRQPWEFQMEELDKAERQIHEIKESLKRRNTITKKECIHEIKHLCEIMNDDMNIPKVLRYVIHLAKRNKREPLRKCLEVLGFQLE